MGCCGGSKAVSDEPVAPATFFFKKRGCTDILCLLIFFLFWGGMFYITYLSVTIGDPNAVFYGNDYLGQRCGVGAMKSKPKTYYPRVDQDMVAQAAIASSMPWKLKFYGLCMEDCPNVTTPAACFADPASCSVKDYGTVAQYTAAGGSASYFATMPSISLLNRCIPNDKSSLTQDADRCAFPQCDGVTYAPCDATYPTTWVMSFPKSLQCKVKFRVGKIEQLAPMVGGTMAKSIGGKVAGIQRVVDSLTASQTEILIFGLAAPTVLGFAWLILLRLFAKTFTYVMIWAIGFGLLVLTLYCFILAGAANELMALLASNSTALTPTGSSSATVSFANDTLAQALGLVTSASDAVAALAPSELKSAVNAAGTANPALWWILAVVLAILTLVYTISMCAARKQIKIAVAIVKESSMVIKDRPATMFFPFGTLALQVGLFINIILIILFLGTAQLGPEHFSGTIQAVSASASFVDSMKAYNASLAANGAAGLVAADNSAFYIQLAVYLYWIFGFLWTLESLNNIGWTSMSGSVSHWYFFREDPEARTRVPLLRSLGRTLRYHLGSIFFGSFIIAVIQLIRLILMAIDRYTKKQQKANFALKLAIKCTQCCMWCLEKTVKFITAYCYIYVAMQGSGFCRSCFATFGLIISHPAQLAINTFVRTILSWIQLLALPISCGFVCNLVLVNQGKAEAVYPTVVVAIMAFVIAKVFSLVFSCVLDTLFVCCARDKSEYKGKYMPDRLREAFGFNKRSKKDKKKGGDEEEEKEALADDAGGKE